MLLNKNWEWNPPQERSYCSFLYQRALIFLRHSRYPQKCQEYFCNFPPTGTYEAQPSLFPNSAIENTITIQTFDSLINSLLLIVRVLIVCQPSPQRPYKIWSCNREIRKSVVAKSLLEFKVRSAEKLGYDNVSELKVVLESDGTEVEDDTYFQTAEKDTIFLLLKSGERWLPPGVEALKAGNYSNHFKLSVHKSFYISLLKEIYISNYYN